MPTPSFPDLLSLGIASRRLESCHEADVATFCEQCSTFFTLVAGEVPAADTARGLLESRPPTVDPTRKHVIGFERAGSLVAIVDLLDGHPDDEDWYVGLLVLLPEQRARGLGKAIWCAVEEWILAAGGRHVRLIVQQQNHEAVLFWRAVGFAAHGTVEQQLQARTNRCWRFEKPLTSFSPPAADAQVA